MVSKLPTSLFKFLLTAGTNLFHRLQARLEDVGFLLSLDVVFIRLLLYFRKPLYIGYLDGELCAKKAKEESLGRR